VKYGGGKGRWGILYKSQSLDDLGIGAGIRKTRVVWGKSGRGTRREQVRKRNEHKVKKIESKKEQREEKSKLKEEYTTKVFTQFFISFSEFFFLML